MTTPSSLTSIALLVTSLVSLPACGDDDGGNGGGGSGSTSTQTGSTTTGGDGGSGASTTSTSGQGGNGQGGDGGGGRGAGGEGPGSGGSAPAGNFGVVTFTNTDLDLGQGPQERGSASAFFREVVAPGSFGCERAEVAGCVRERCPTPAANPPEYAFREVGAITVTGTDVPVSYTYVEGGGYYDFIREDGFLFTPGAVLTFEAEAGEAVPAFTAAVTAPAHAVFTSPATFEGLVIDRSAGLDLAWDVEGDGDGLVRAIVVSNHQDGDVFVTDRVTCDLPMAAGAGTVPAEALELLEPNASGAMQFYDWSEDVQIVDDWTLTIWAQRNGPFGSATIE